MIVTLAVIAAGLVFLALAVHPFTTYPASLWLLARLRPRPLAATGPRPATAALCVCAYNEERVIRDKALNMLAMQDAFPGLELLVYVDAGTDRTAEVLREFEGRIRTVIAPQRTGKSVGMNRLVAMTSADALVFSDANVMFDAHAIPRLLAPFADPAVGVVCGHLKYGVPENNATAATGSLYWRLEEQIKRMESATGSVMGADGSIFAVRRTAHRSPPSDLIDDMFVSLTALCDGARIVRADDAIAYEEQVSQASEEFRRKIRIGCQAFNVQRALWPRLRQLGGLDLYKYVSHKLLRWLVAYSLAAGCTLVAVGLARLGGWQLLGMATIAAGIPFVSVQLRSILMAFLGTGLGVLRSLQGSRFQTWSPPASARGLVTKRTAG